MTDRPSRTQRIVAASWRPLLALAVVGLAAWVVLGLGPLYESRSEDDPASGTVVAPSKRPERPPGWRTRPRAQAVPEGCKPEHERVCLQGDAWWLDSCGTPHAIAEECVRVRCSDGACGVPDTQCVDAPTSWRCDGDVARGCSAGKVFEVDCAGQGRRCVMTEEGPVCRERTDHDCDTPPDETRCEGTTLVACVEGRTREVDCANLGALCLPGRGGAGFRCVRVAAPAGPDACGPCGCPPRFDAEELCNGRDDDGDGYIDEGAECGVVDIVAFVATDEGAGAYTEEDLKAEIEQVNDFFARDDEYGLEFRLADVIALDREAWLEVDDVETQEILVSNALLNAREGFYIPILFVDVLLFEEVPRPGLATPPNGICGGQRRVQSPQPGVGGIIIAKQRWPTTVAHEVGHFLGLCHTHMPGGDAVEVYEGEGDPDGAQACQEPCAYEGDGICDTPDDPGPPGCQADALCTVQCEGEASPSAENVMGYYPSCRASFTEQQALTMRHGLSMRRGWHDCLTREGCACEPAVGDCPEQMSCRQYQDTEGAVTWRCGLDGAVVPGGICASSIECGKQSTCVQSASGEARCVRPCRLGTDMCNCRLLPGIDYPLCADDFEG